MPMHHQPVCSHNRSPTTSCLDDHASSVLHPKETPCLLVAYSQPALLPTVLSLAVTQAPRTRVAKRASQKATYRCSALKSDYHPRGALGPSGVVPCECIRATLHDMVWGSGAHASFQSKRLFSRVYYMLLLLQLFSSPCMP